MKLNIVLVEPEIPSNTGNISRMVEEMEEKKGVHYVKIIARE